MVQTNQCNRYFSCPLCLRPLSVEKDGSLYQNDLHKGNILIRYNELLYTIILLPILIDPVNAPGSI